MSSRNPKTFLLVLALALGLLAAGCGGDDGDDTTASSLPEGCTEVEQPAPKDAAAQPPKEQLKGSAVAVVETSCGSFEINLDTVRSPKTASSFAGLAEQGFYDDTPFHRIVPGLVIQGGDPAGTGSGGPGYSVDEPPPDDFAYVRGTVAMAKTSAEPPGRSGSQFFIVTAPADAGYPPDYAVLGTVTEGFDVVQRIESLASAADGPPSSPVVVNTITIRRG